MITKLKQLWCWLRHEGDHAGVTLLPGHRYRCKKCGYEGSL
jgi:hypothetical protein